MEPGERSNQLRKTQQEYSQKTETKTLSQLPSRQQQQQPLTSRSEAESSRTEQLAIYEHFQMIPKIHNFQEVVIKDK